MLDYGADINNPGARQSPLGKAAPDSVAKRAQFLLGKGADVNLVDREFGSPLVSAAQGSTARGVGLDTEDCDCYKNRMSKIVFMLIDNGADVNLADGVHETALTEAALRGDSSSRICCYATGRVSTSSPESTAARSPGQQLRPT